MHKLKTFARSIVDSAAQFHMPLRRFFLPALVLAIGYALGYQDAFRGPASLGWRLGELVDRFTPESVIEARKRNAEAIRQRVQDAVAQPE